MATTPTLLSIPLEIRRHIYSYLLPNAAKINIVRDDMDGPLHPIRICRDVYHEAVDYFYSTNIFLLDLTDPAYAPNRFFSGTRLMLKYIRRVQTLYLLIGDSFSPNDDAYTFSKYAREQFDWFLGTLREANEGREGWWLKNLVVLDCCETSVLKEVTRRVVEKGEKRREVFVLPLEPFKSRIRDIRIESRALSQARRYDARRDTEIGSRVVGTHTLLELLIV